MLGVRAGGRPRRDVPGAEDVARVPVLCRLRAGEGERAVPVLRGAGAAGTDERGDDVSDSNESGAAGCVGGVFMLIAWGVVVYMAVQVGDDYRDMKWRVTELEKVMAEHRQVPK